jgi:hypothetical protein
VRSGQRSRWRIRRGWSAGRNWSSQSLRAALRRRVSRNKASSYGKDHIRDLVAVIDQTDKNHRTDAQFKRIFCFHTGNQPEVFKKLPYSV